MNAIGSLSRFRFRIQRLLHAMLLASLMLASTAGCTQQGRNMSNGASFDNPTHAPLADAVHRGDAALARTLIADGASPNAVDSQGVPMLEWVMRQHDRDALDLLLDLRADPARGNRQGQTVMHIAAMAKDDDWLQTLLARGLSPNQPNTMTAAPPLFDALRARSGRNIQRLLKAGARLDARDRNGNTALHQAALVGDGASARILLEAGADPRATDNLGATFDAYLFDGDPSMLSPQAKRELDAIDGLLRARGIEPARPKTR